MNSLLLNLNQILLAFSLAGFSLLAQRTFKKNGAFRFYYRYIKGIEINAKRRNRWLITQLELYHKIIHDDIQLLNPIFEIQLTLFIALNNFLKWLSFPLGVCIYCNGSWIAIIMYLTLNPLNWLIVPFLGANYIFTMLLVKSFQDSLPQHRNINQLKLRKIKQDFNRLNQLENEFKPKRKHIDTTI